MIGDVALPLPVELIHFEEILEAKNKEAINTLKDAEKLDELAGALAKQGESVTPQAIAKSVGSSESLVAAFISEARFRSLNRKAALKTLPA